MGISTRHRPPSPATGQPGGCNAVSERFPEIDGHFQEMEISIFPSLAGRDRFWRSQLVSAGERDGAAGRVSGAMGGDAGSARGGDRVSRCLSSLVPEGLLGGPLALLERGMRTRRRVLVVTRHRNGIRGVCCGVVACFDKHFNLVLRDVDEQYSVLHTLTAEDTDGGGASGENSHRHEKRGKKKLKYYKRHLPQVLIRGESVVLVSLNPEGASKYFASPPS